MTLVAVASLAAARDKPVTHIAGQIYVLHTSAGDASLPLESSVDLHKSHPDITRAVIVFHGKGRNVEGYYHALESAAAMRITWCCSRRNFYAPKISRPTAYRHSSCVGTKERGPRERPALAPLPLSTFSIIDALLQDLGNRERFPNLATVVLFGHSAAAPAHQSLRHRRRGARGINRGRHPCALRDCNPSSYFYFTMTVPNPTALRRPTMERTAQISIAGVTDRHAPLPMWSMPPKRLGNREKSPTPEPMSSIFWARRIQTPNNGTWTPLARAKRRERSAWIAAKVISRYLEDRHPGEFHQQLWFVPGVAHVGSRMVESPCGVTAAFDSGTCGTQAAN